MNAVHPYKATPALVPRGKKVPFLYLNLIEEKQNSRMLSKDLQVALSSKPEALKSVIGGYKQ